MDIPKEVKHIAKELEDQEFKAYPVGGSVRDVLLGKEPKDWDIATDARPEKVQEIFPENVYENEFGTVAVKTGSEDDALRLIEVTTFRTDGKYSDKRHPDKIEFADTIEDDLSRRDFTVNAMALKVTMDGERWTADDLVDPFGGKEDLENKIIKAVGNPDERFKEDALRLMRAVRFAAELSGFSTKGGPASGWEIEEETMKALVKNADLLTKIAVERVRDEFVKIIMADKAMRGVQLLEDVGLLKHIVPELREGIGCEQAGHHTYTVWEHNLKSLKYSADQGYPLRIRLGALFHDIAKPHTKEGTGEDATFYNHEVVGGKMAKDIMKRLKFSKDLTNQVSHLVRHHLFYYDIGEVTESGVRRFLKRVGPENVDDLIKIRKADRIGSGVPKAVPYRLRHFLFMIDKVKRDPISTKQLAVDGDVIMKTANIDPGPKVGNILEILLDKVLDAPEQNKKEHLRKRIEEIAKWDDDKIQKKAEEAKEKIQRQNQKEIKKLKEKHHVD